MEENHAYGGMKMKHFEFSRRLGIYIPRLEIEWEKLTELEQESILMQWEEIRGHIPDQIAAIETIINQKQAALDSEDDFTVSCRLNSEISEHASVINDLWLWFRQNQHVSERIHQ